jgi:hypothetical protein
MVHRRQRSKRTPIGESHFALPAERDTDEAAVVAEDLLGG